MDITLVMAIVGVAISLFSAVVIPMLWTTSKRDVKHLEAVNDALRIDVGRSEAIARAARQKAEEFEKLAKRRDREATEMHRQLNVSEADGAKMLRALADTRSRLSRADARIAELSAAAEFNHNRVVGLQSQLIQADARHAQLTAEKKKISDQLTARDIELKYYRENYPPRGPAVGAVLEAVLDMGEAPSPPASAGTRRMVPGGLYDPAAVPPEVSDAAELVKNWFMQNTAQRGWAYKGICDRWYVSQYCMGVRRLRGARQRLGIAEGAVKDAQAERDQAVTDSCSRAVRCSELEYLLAQSKDNLNSVRRRCTELSEGLAQMQQIKDERVAALEHEVYKWTTIASQLRNKDANTSFTFSMPPWTVTGTQRKATA